MKEFDEDKVYHEMYMHLLWSTTSQKPQISASVAPHLYGYLCDLTLNEGCHLIDGSLFSDHIQLVIKFTPDTIFSDLITNLKVASLLWIRANFPEIERFEWQKSDFRFSVGVDEVGTLTQKIKNSQSFKEVVYSLLDQHEIKYHPDEVLD